MRGKAESGYLAGGHVFADLFKQGSDVYGNTTIQLVLGIYVPSTTPLHS